MKRFRRLFRLPIRRRDLLEEDLDAEIRLHLDLRAEQLEAMGMTREQARAEARRRFGSAAAMQDDAQRRERALDLRERLADLIQDLRLAGRRLRQAPTFAAAAILTLALGIGANTAIFSVVAPILFEPLPYPDPQRIVMVWERELSGASSNVGFATFADLAREGKSFETAAALGDWSPTLTGDGAPERLSGQRVSPAFFSVLGVMPALGRDFRPEDDVRGEQRVVLLGHSLWQRRFGGDAEIIGKPIALDGSPALVLGVLPASFESLLAPSAEIWTPLRYEVSLPWACRTCRHLRMVARLHPAISPAQAEREMSTLLEGLSRQYPTEYAAPGMRVAPLHHELTHATRPALLAIFGAVGLVLLIACANVTNLLLARAGQRRGDLAIRTTLGATRWRVIRSLLAESLLLAGLGGAVGVAVAMAGVRGLVAISPPGLPRLEQAGVDGPVLVFALVITALVGVIFGLIPGLQLTRDGLWRSIGQGRRIAGGSHRLRAALVVAQVALTLMLLVGAGLLLRSLGRLVAVPTGFEPRGLLTLQIQVSGPRYQSDEATRAFFERVLEGARALPGVDSAALTSQLPLSDDFDLYGTHFEHNPRANPEEDPSAHRYAISPGYLATLGLPLRRGRDFDAHDTADQPAVVLISESFARRELPGVDPIGQRIRVGSAIEGPWRTIVGVVGDAKQLSLAAGHGDAVYHPASQWPWADNILSLVLRTQGDPLRLVVPVRELVRGIDPDQPVTRVATMQQLLTTSAARTRFALLLFEVFAGVALALAAVGLFGVLAGSVAERRTEIGVRTALGATRREILEMVVRQGLALVALGAGLGLVASLGFGEAIEGMLFEVSRIDPLTYLEVIVLLGLVAVLACWIPARRAARVDPVEALRAE